MSAFSTAPQRPTLEIVHRDNLNVTQILNLVRGAHSGGEPTLILFWSPLPQYQVVMSTEEVFLIFL